MLKKIIVHEKDAFLFSDLLEDIKCSSELSGLTEFIISNTRTLKKELLISSQMYLFLPKGQSI